MPYFYTSTPITHLNAKKGLFSPHCRWQRTTKRTRLSYNISRFQKIPIRSDHSQHLYGPPPLLLHSSPQNPKCIKFQICPPSRDFILFWRKTIHQVSTKPLEYHWKWSTTTQHLAQHSHHCYHKTKSLKDILVYSRQAKPTSLHSAPNEHHQ